MGKVLIIEDDPVIAEGIADTIVFHGWEAVRAADGLEGTRLAMSGGIDLIILDIMLPKIDGFAVCQKIKENRPEIPVIMLTARGQESEKLLGFELGADDYLTKPFSLKELVARIKVALRRQGTTEKIPVDQGNIAIGRAQIDFMSYTIEKGGQTFSLSPKECDILRFLVNHPGEVIRRDRIIDAVWKDEYDPIPRTIDNFILKLRAKIEEDPANPRHLLTVHGAGYKMVLKP